MIITVETRDCFMTADVVQQSEVSNVVGAVDLKSFLLGNENRT